MEIIKAEEFLSQPKEIQKVFLEWWQPEIFDLVHINFKYYEDEIDNGNNQLETVITEKDVKTYGGLDFFNPITGGIDGNIIPLLTEGQLRKFIEDKTNSNRIELECGVNKYIFYLYCEDKTKHTIYFNISYEIYENHSLLQAYWKLAIMLAKLEEREEE